MYTGSVIFFTLLTAVVVRPPVFNGKVASFDATAAKAVGNSELEAKFVKGGELLKRDIVFCGSLYL